MLAKSLEAREMGRASPHSLLAALVMPARLAQFMDPRLEANPALARGLRARPGGRPQQYLPSSTASCVEALSEDGVSEPDHPAYRALLQENPVQQAWRIEPKAILLQLAARP